VTLTAASLSLSTRISCPAALRFTCISIRRNGSM
jgi:hypothetical protein